MLKTAVGLALGFLVGAGCRYFDVPVPGPPKFVGALVVVSVTLGYLAADRLMGGAAGATSARPERSTFGGKNP